MKQQTTGETDSLQTTSLWAEGSPGNHQHAYEVSFIEMLLKK